MANVKSIRNDGVNECLGQLNPGSRSSSRLRSLVPIGLGRAKSPCGIYAAVAATSDLYTAPTRNLAASTGTLAKRFLRWFEGLISYFGIIFRVNFNFISLWNTHKGILKLLNVLKHLEIILKLSYIEKNVWWCVFLGWNLRKEGSEGPFSLLSEMRWVGLCC